MEYTRRDKKEAIERELLLRRRAYPRLIAMGQLREKEAAYQLEIMEAIAADYMDRPRRETESTGVTGYGK